MTPSKPKAKREEARELARIEGWVISCDPLQVIVCEEGSARNHYYPRMYQALTYLAEQVARREAKTLAEYVAVFQRVGKDIQAACGGA